MPSSPQASFTPINPIKSKHNEVETSHILQEMDKVKAEMSAIEETGNFFHFFHFFLLSYL